MAQGGLLLFTDAYAMLSGPQGCGHSLVPGRWVLQMGITDVPDNVHILCVF